MKLLGLLAVVTTCCIAAIGSEQEESVLKSTADSLDSLVSQKKPVFREIHKPGFEPNRKRVEPVELKLIAPVVAANLRVNQEQVTALLKDDQKKLSDIVLARALEESSGKTWRELLKKYRSEELMSLATERQITPKVKRSMEGLYTELSFIAFDSMEKSDQGTAPAGTKGTSKGTGKSAGETTDTHTETPQR